MTADDAIEKVKDLHAPVFGDTMFCGECSSYSGDGHVVLWPCPTIKAVTG